MANICDNCLCVYGDDPYELFTFLSLFGEVDSDKKRIKGKELAKSLREDPELVKKLTEGNRKNINLSELEFIFKNVYNNDGYNNDDIDQAIKFKLQNFVPVESSEEAGQLWGRNFDIDEWYMYNGFSYEAYLDFNILPEIEKNKDLQGKSVFFLTWFTKWAPMDRPWATVSELFPNLTFRFVYEEGGCQLAGVAFYNTGDQIYILDESNMDAIDNSPLLKKKTVKNKLTGEENTFENDKFYVMHMTLSSDGYICQNYGECKCGYIYNYSEWEDNNEKCPMCGSNIEEPYE